MSWLSKTNLVTGTGTARLPPVVFLFRAFLSSLCRILVFGVVELAWNTYPSTTASSVSLHVCHVIILASLWINTGVVSMQGRAVVATPPRGGKSDDKES